MPRYKRIDTGMKFLPIDLSVQLLPGAFEHALAHLIDHEFDLRGLDERFKNAESGAPPSCALGVAQGGVVCLPPRHDSLPRYRPGLPGERHLHGLVASTSETDRFTSPALAGAALSLPARLNLIQFHRLDSVMPVLF